MANQLFDQYGKDFGLKNLIAPTAEANFTVEDLKFTARESHPISEEAVVSVGFLGKLFSGTSKIVKRGLVQETKWYTNVEIEGKTVQYGVSVRLAVAATSIGLDDFSVSLPNLSAAAQLGFTEAKAGIYTVGFNDFSPTLSPDTLDLSVENFTEFKEAYDKTVAHVFLQENRNLIKPALLMKIEA